MVGQRYLDLVPQDPRAIFDAYFSSYVSRSSFTYAFLVSTIAALYIVSRRTFSISEKIILLGILNLFYDHSVCSIHVRFLYGALHAPDSDKGLTRFSLSIFVTCSACYHRFCY